MAVGDYDKDVGDLSGCRFLIRADRATRNATVFLDLRPPFRDRSWPSTRRLSRAAGLITPYLDGYPERVARATRDVDRVRQ